MNKKIVAITLSYIVTASAFAEEYKECKSLSADQYQIAAHKEGFVAKVKDTYVYITRNSETNLFKENVFNIGVVRVKGTDDGKHVIFAGKGGVSIVNVASKKAVEYTLDGGVTHAQLQVLNGYAYGLASSGDLIKLNMNKKEMVAKPFDSKSHYWLSTWNDNGKIYILAQGAGALSKDPAYVMALDASLNLGEKISNKNHFAMQRDSAMGGKNIEDSGFIGSFGTQLWIVQIFEDRVVNKLPRFDYDRVDAYNGYVYARAKNGGSVSIFKFGSDQPIQNISGVNHLIALSKSGNEMIVKMKDDAIKMYCR